jgi:hypothetical protein
LSDSQSSFPLFNGDINQLEKRLWESADQLRANSSLILHVGQYVRVGVHRLREGACPYLSWAIFRLIPWKSASVAQVCRKL